jgi:hypothetical protein
MRKILGFGVVLAAAYLTGTVGAAYGQQRGGATAPNTIANQAINEAMGAPTPGQPGGIGGNTAAPANVQVPGTAGSVLNQAGVTGTAPGNPQAPGTAGSVLNQTGVTGSAPGNYQAPGTAGNVLNQTGVTGSAPGNYQAPGTAGNVLNQAGVTGTSAANPAQGMMAPGTTYTRGVTNAMQGNYPANPATSAIPGVQQGTYPGTATGAAPGYVSRVMPGMSGYNSVNPMATTMAPGYYYAGTAGMPSTTYNSPGYVTPGYYGTQTGPYVVQRRGLFGRRNRIVYPASPYGSTTYGTSPSGYTTYGTPTYSTTPGAYTYGTTTYSTPVRYTYGAYPY